MRINIFQEAENIIHGDREATYGRPDKNLLAIANQWSLYLHDKYGSDTVLTAEDVCWMMVDLKKCRQMNAPKRDNLVDGAGYIGLIERIQDADKREGEEDSAKPRESRAGAIRTAKRKNL